MTARGPDGKFVKVFAEGPGWTATEHQTDEGRIISFRPHAQPTQHWDRLLGGGQWVDDGPVMFQPRQDPDIGVDVFTSEYIQREIFEPMREGWAMPMEHFPIVTRGYFAPDIADLEPARWLAAPTPLYDQLAAEEYVHGAWVRTDNQVVVSGGPWTDGMIAIDKMRQITEMWDAEDDGYVGPKHQGRRWLRALIRFTAIAVVGGCLLALIMSTS